MNLRRHMNRASARLFRGCCNRSAEFQSAVSQVSKLQTSGSVLVIVLWIALGLVTIALYFANSMSFELRASDNSIAGLAADQAIEAGARYVLSVLALSSTNGGVPDITSYRSQAVPVGD